MFGKVISISINGWSTSFCKNPQKTVTDTSQPVFVTGLEVSEPHVPHEV